MLISLFLGVYLVILVILIYSLFFGSCSVHKHGYFHAMYLYLTRNIPDAFHSFIFAITPRLTRKHTAKNKRKTKKYVPYLILLSYYTLYHLIAIVFLIKVYPSISEFVDRPEYYQMATYCLIIGPWLVFIVLQIVDPGVINKDNVNFYMDLYPYDNIIYKKCLCKVFEIPAVARSRYCEFTQQRVARYDHFSPLILQVVGEKNLRYYLLFIILNICTNSFLLYISIRMIVWVFGEYIKPKIVNHSTLSVLLMTTSTFLKKEPFSIGLVLALLIVNGGWVAFFAKQVYCISCNITFAERKEYNGVNFNFYDEGLIDNWKKVLFPTTF